MVAIDGQRVRDAELRDPVGREAAGLGLDDVVDHLPERGARWR